MILFSAASLILLYKKPHDKAVILFFIFLQCIISTVNASYLNESDPFSMLATVAFILCGPFLGPVLIHFQLIFPKPSKIIKQNKSLPLLFYIPGAVFAVITSIFYIREWIDGRLFSPVFHVLNKISLWWLSGTFILAIAIAIYQYITIRDTLIRNQLKILLTGAFFTLVLGIFGALFYESIQKFGNEFPVFIPLLNGFTRFILIGCILIAIFRFRIWNIEVVLKKALLYLGATFIIILTYLLVLFIADILTIRETKATRFIILAFSVIIFLMLRDRLQKLIDRLFHRETYDSATVVSDFEEKMAGGYRIEELGSRILNLMDKIFHFNSIRLCFKKERLSYEPAFVLGKKDDHPYREFQINTEFENKLLKQKVFSPGELSDPLAIPDPWQVELVVPMVKDGKPFGFFLCGPKKSEKSYSMQDIRVLSLIAKRVIALFQTAALYQKDLERQLMLERERARISQDMHDDIGASLTRISMMTEMVKNREDVGDGARQWLGQISGTSRGLMEEMSQIIWALNPKNDNLEGLVAYIRRFAFEYLEPVNIKCDFDLPEKLPETALTVETRRNIYLVVREALHNVVKHSMAGKVEIRFSILNSRFSISIKDDGKGFDLEKLEFPGNGLVNMKKRMADIGGGFVIKSEPGIGTEIELMVSLK
jgi:signal transduction histidine kinase